MATNLLLEGDDLEALLVRARVEGGPDARIVRAEKVRAGGVFGFFARETFEVAVEIPEPAGPPPGDPAAAANGPGSPGGPGGPDVTSAPWATGGAGRGGTAPPAVPETSFLASRPGGLTGSVQGDAAYDELAERMAQIRARAGVPDQGGLAADGLLSIVDRVSAAERAAARASAGSAVADLAGVRELARARQAATRPAAAKTPLRRAGPPQGAAAYAAAAAYGTEDLAHDGPARHDVVEQAATGTDGASARRPGGTLSTAPFRRAGLPAQPTASPAPLLSPSRPGPSRPGPSRPGPSRLSPPAPAASRLSPSGLSWSGSAMSGSAMSGSAMSGSAMSGSGTLEPAGTPGRPIGQIAGDPIASVAPMASAEPAGRPSDPPRPSPVRPEFTALLDHLRSNAVGRQRGDGTVVPLPVRPKAAPAHPDPTERGDPGDPQEPGPGSEQTDPSPVAPTGRPASAALPALALPRSASVVAAQPLTWSSPVAPAALATVPAIAAADAAAVRGTPTAMAPATVVRPAGASDEGVAPRSADPRVAGDRQRLRELGVPVAWTRRLRPGDRFAAVLRALDRMPELDVDPTTAVVAVVGPPALVHLEAARIAVDLAPDVKPRPVVCVPLKGGATRGAAISRAQRTGVVVVAVEADGYTRPEAVVETLEAVGAGAVVAIIDACRALEEAQRWIDALGQVDAITAEGATLVPDPAACLQLGLPVIRLDGVALDQVTWTALLCSMLEAADPALEPMT